MSKESVLVVRQKGQKRKREESCEDICSVENEGVPRKKRAKVTAKGGDHVYVWRSFLGVPLYKHHGICVGHNEVIHYTGSSKHTAFVQKTSLSEFCAGAPLQIMEHPGSELSAHNVVENALLMEGMFRGQYNLVSLNCEHIANFCTTGLPVSPQIDKYLSLIHISEPTRPY
eukprot:TRINITY_DN7134_c0_g1_i1.p1 TRINITY_DN7134_c0_g1~~TRINITY_DN7134_c0_g1_i1.p1  ORF type:complete len:171 (-),score=5.90 TRINITY_DN7134_c0_g1_i1:17-529(-)